MQVQPWSANLRRPGGDEAKPDLQQVTWYKHAVRLPADLSVEQPGPEGCRDDCVRHVERDRFQSQRPPMQPRRARRLYDLPLAEYAATKNRQTDDSATGMVAAPAAP